jgi:P-type Ca2+ transporter type 2C
MSFGLWLRIDCDESLKLYVSSLSIRCSAVTVRALYTLSYPKTKFGFTGLGYNAKSGHLIYLSENNMAGQRVPEGGESEPVLSALLYTACLCNNATLVQDLNTSVAEGHTGGALSGQPTELALLVAAAKAGFTDPRPQYHRLQEIPFSSERKRMDVRARPVNGRHSCDFFEKMALSEPTSVDGSLYFVKGMPEKVIGECSGYCQPNGAMERLDEEGRTIALLQSRRMAASGLRVIALAYGQSLGSMTFAGLIGMEDPPREGVADSVRQLRQGGVKCLMITGDAKETAIAIAKRCGILGGAILYDASEHGLDDLLHTAPPISGNFDDESVSDIEYGSSEALSGSEIDEMSPQNLADCINAVKVFYRVSPRHKLAIVRARKLLPFRFWCASVWCKIAHARLIFLYSFSPKQW